MAKSPSLAGGRRTLFSSQEGAKPFPATGYPNRVQASAARRAARTAQQYAVKLSMMRPPTVLQRRRLA